MMKFNEMISMLCTEQELKTKRMATKIDKLCDEDLVYCDECPYYIKEEGHCTINQYLK